MAEPGVAIRRGRKFQQVLDGARAVFLRHGFEGAGVDDIARTAGVSKATLYSYFPDKRLLFMEVARLECQRQADEALEKIDLTASPETVLRRAAETMLSFFLSDFGQRVHRIAIAESGRFPELGRQFYENGPKLARQHVADYLSQACARGELAIDDVPLAADQFVELCKADLFLRRIMGVADGFTEAEVARVIDGAVAMFLARYGAPR
jgi:TetR/AcrR family transcriptional regulator, mexJK operon transcriptional repressor